MEIGEELNVFITHSKKAESKDVKSYSNKCSKYRQNRKITRELKGVFIDG